MVEKHFALPTPFNLSTSSSLSVSVLPGVMPPVYYLVNQIDHFFECVVRQPQLYLFLICLYETSMFSISVSCFLGGIFPVMQRFTGMNS